MCKHVCKCMLRMCVCGYDFMRVVRAAHTHARTHIHLHTYAHFTTRTLEGTGVLPALSAVGVHEA